jgi:acyl-CoA thioester hydrolase
METARGRIDSLRLALPKGIGATKIRAMGERHRTPITVAFDEVDMYGIVHHSKLLVYLERARIALFVEGGVVPGTLEETGFGLILVDANLRFKAPARFHEELVVETWVERHSPVTITFAYRILRDDQVLLEATTRLAAVGPDARPTRIPDGPRELLKRYFGGEP